MDIVEFSQSFGFSMDDFDPEAYRAMMETISEGAIHLGNLGGQGGGVSACDRPLGTLI